MKYGFYITFLIALCLFVGCRKEQHEQIREFSAEDFKAWKVSEYMLNSARIRSEIHRLSAQKGIRMYADAFTRNYYNRHGAFLWIDRMGAGSRADTLLSWLAQTPALGLKKSSFHVDEITADLEKLRRLRFSPDESINTVAARVEFNLTQAYLRYVCGQRFGYVNPYTCFNRLERTDTTRNAPYRRLFDIPTETATDSFVHVALQQIRQERFTNFLTGIQPTHPVYRRLLQAYQSGSDTLIQSQKLLVNLERSRWRTPQPSGKYVWVNIAGFTLTAVNEEQEEILRMRVCGGDLRHKTPLLYSLIDRVEFNPYWIIPTSIIKREIAPRHAGSSTYFERNRIRILNKATGEEMDPTELSAAQLKSGKYTLRQDRGEGNSLGRMIFRFPNNFSVFLHDTNNRSAFTRKIRAISHGCVRVERPLDLAIFLMNEPQPDVIDRMRIAIDLPPLTAQGRQEQQDPDRKKISVYPFSPTIPVFIHYYTVYPSPNGALETFPDSYGYDEVLQQKLNAF